MFNSKEFGYRLKKLRIQYNLTQQQISDALHISLNHAYKLENGSRQPSLDLCIDICAFFNVSMDFLLLGETHPMSAKESIHHAIHLLLRAEEMVSLDS